MKIFYALIVIFFYSNSYGQAFKFPKIIGAAVTNAETLNINTKRMAQYRVYYLGNYSDTIRIEYNILATMQQHDSLLSSEKQSKKYLINPYWTDSLLQIFIDISQKIVSHNMAWEDGIDSFNAFPVLLKNNSDSIALVGYGIIIPFIVEALDTDGKWKPIEEQFMYKCGTGLRRIYLNPKSYACVLIPEYNGNFRTQLRIRIRNVFSNPFWGEINKKQF